MTNEQMIKNQAIHWAWETHFNRFNLQDKPSAEEIIEAARKFEDYLRENEVPPVETPF